MEGCVRARAREQAARPVVRSRQGPDTRAVGIHRVSRERKESRYVHVDGAATSAASASTDRHCNRIPVACAVAHRAPVRRRPWRQARRPRSATTTRRRSVDDDDNARRPARVVSTYRTQPSIPETVRCSSGTCDPSVRLRDRRNDDAAVLHGVAACSGPADGNAAVRRDPAATVHVPRACTSTARLHATASRRGSTPRRRVEAPRHGVVSRRRVAMPRRASRRRRLSPGVADAWGSHGASGRRGCGACVTQRRVCVCVCVCVCCVHPRSGSTRCGNGSDERGRAGVPGSRRAAALPRLTTRAHGARSNAPHLAARRSTFLRRRAGTAPPQQSTGTSTLFVVWTLYRARTRTVPPCRQGTVGEVLTRRTRHTPRGHTRMAQRTQQVAPWTRGGARCVPRMVRLCVLRT